MSREPDSTGRDPKLEAEVVVAPPTHVSASVTRVLVTNDDGIESPGLEHLVAALAEAFDVTVAAPSSDWSGAGTSIGRFDPRVGIPLRRTTVGSSPAFVIDGPPGLAVLAGALGAFGEPFGAVVSGVNAGINTGHSVIHSGTVGAALTARTFGAHGVAVSLDPAERWEWDTAATIGCAAACWLTTRARTPTTLNVNVPGIPLADVRGLRASTLDDFGFFRVAIADEGRDTLEFEVRTDTTAAPEGSDSWLLARGYATITALGQLTARDDVLPDDLDEVWRRPR